MTRIEREQNFAAECVSRIKFHRTHYITLRTNAEEFGFYRIKVVARVNFLSEDQVEGFEKQASRCLAICRRVFISVWNPDVGHGGGIQFSPKVFANFTAGDTMLHPKLANSFITMRKRKSIGRFRM